MTHTPIQIIAETSVYEVLVEARKSWSHKDIIKDIITFCAEQPDLTFEIELLKAIQKFKEANE
jgi:hypothetical protein